MLSNDYLETQGRGFRIWKSLESSLFGIFIHLSAKCSTGLPSTSTEGSGISFRRLKKVISSLKGSKNFTKKIEI